MPSYSFKHVGQTTNISDKSLDQTSTPIGIKTPLQLDYNGEIIVLHHDLADQLHDNLKNLLLTNWGERVGLYDFGANLKPITTELVSDENYDIEALTRIKNAVNRWMPYISLNNFFIEDSKTYAGVSVKKLTVTYEIPSLNVTEKAIQIVLNMI